MKNKKPPSAKAVKPARRTVRRLTRGKPGAPRRKTSPAKRTSARRKRARKPAPLAKAKTRGVPKTKKTRRLIARKPRARRSPLIKVGRAVPSAPRPLAEISPPKPLPHIPPILLEEDEPAPFLTGLDQKYALGPTPPTAQPGPQPAQLPDAYGTGKLVLIARDSHCLYAHWDLSLPQQRRCNALSADRHLVVRLHSGAVGAAPPKDVHVHPESRHWFIHVDHAGAQYVAELGYYRPKRQWTTLATSALATTPPDTVSDDQTLRFATIPAHVRLRRLVALAQQAVPASLSAMAAARERALAELVGLHLLQQEGVSSAEFVEVLRPPVEQAVSPSLLAGEAGSVSSPFGVAEQPPPGFWL